jgi:hypothetical protein
MEGPTKTLKVTVVGEESLSNLRLADTLRNILGKENVYRYLELHHLIEFLSKNHLNPVIVFLDLFGYDLVQVTETIGTIRQKYPSVVFNLYMDRDDFKGRWRELPREWATRLDHYFRTYKQSADVEIEPIIRLALRLAQDESLLSLGKIQRELDARPTIQKNALPSHSAPKTVGEIDQTIFLSYSRSDWDTFVSNFANQLTEHGYNVWVDQQFLIGGSNWMDSVGDALNKCRLLLLVVSPESLASKYVKMEYRYFINNGKIVLPVLHKSAPLPFELSATQHLDFSQANTAQTFAKLRAVLDHHLTTHTG